MRWVTSSIESVSYLFWPDIVFILAWYRIYSGLISYSFRPGIVIILTWYLIYCDQVSYWLWPVSCLFWPTMVNDRIFSCGVWTILVPEACYPAELDVMPVGLNLCHKYQENRIFIRVRSSYIPTTLVSRRLRIVWYPTDIFSWSKPCGLGLVST